MEREIGYRSLHARLRRERGLARDHACVDCGEPAHGWSYDHECPDEVVGLHRGRPTPYSLDLERYDPRCRSCHSKFDNRYAEPCAAPNCTTKVRRPLMYCHLHPALNPRPAPEHRYRGGGRPFGQRMPVDATGRAYAPRRTAVTAAFTHKVCGQCKVEKPVTSFSTRGADAASRRDPFKSRCLQCDRERSNARYAKRKAERAA